MCRYDHQDRLTAKEAQGHPYFAPVREAEAKKQSTLSSQINEVDKNSFRDHPQSSSGGPVGEKDDVTVTSSTNNPSDPFVGECDAHCILSQSILLHLLRDPGPLR